jgi:DNA repair photolyase
VVDDTKPLVFKGRGAASNADDRYAQYRHEAFDDGWGMMNEALEPLRTQVSVDASRSIISWNESPDIPFDRSINPYRGCEHGCVYCYARPSHAYLGLSPGLDFESRIFAKPDAATLLRRELGKPSYRCQTMVIGSNTDCYQPVEREMRITRAALKVLAAYDHPVSLVTKSSLVERDIDILAPMAQKGLAEVFVTVTSLDRTLSRHLEPRAAAPQRRLETIRHLAEAGIPVGVMTAPIIPALNDAEMETILESARDVGASMAAYVLLRLPMELADLFDQWLRLHAPLKADHVLSLIRQSRGGKAYDSSFHTRMKGQGIYAEMIAKRFQLACKRLGYNLPSKPLDTSRFKPPMHKNPSTQLDLFD